MNPSLLIIYGSQTGNAQDVAELISREASRRHFRPRVLPADAYYRTSITSFPTEHTVLFIVSTTGQGDPPTNIAEFWKFLRRKSLGASSLATLNMAVFGLGDSGYLKYNIMAKLLYRRLESLGANPIVPLGLGDDQHSSGYDAALDVWLPQLWNNLRKLHPLLSTPNEPFIDPPVNEIIAQLKPKYRVTILDPLELQRVDLEGINRYAQDIAAAAALDRLDAIATGLYHEALPFAVPHTSSGAEGGSLNGNTTQRYSADAPFFATLKANTRVTAPTHFQDVRLLEMDLTGSHLEYNPGDIISLWPRQKEASLEAFLQFCGLNGQTWIRIQSITDTLGSAECITDSITMKIGPLIAGALDIDGAVPRRAFFQFLAQVAPPGLHKDRLLHFSSPKGRDELHEYCRREGRTVLEILKDFPPVMEALKLAPALFLEWMISYCPRLRPRQFSVASSLSLQPNTAQLLVAVVEWTTRGRRKRFGLCSNWLAGLEEGRKIAVWSEKGALKAPNAIDSVGKRVPLIFIGPGTGVAPFRSMLQDRWAVVRCQPGVTNSPTDTLAPCVLFFGCRSEHADFYCRAEWEKMQAAGVLGGPLSTSLGEQQGLITAFSRDQEKKLYVTHRIREHGAALWQMISQQGAAILVAGSADKMPADVWRAFRDVVQEHGGINDINKAEKYLKTLEMTGRYQVECWS